MKTTAITTALLLLYAAGASAITVPATEDTYSSKGTLTASAGKGTTLSVTATRKAFVQFDLASLPQMINPSFITGARVRVYVSLVKPAASILKAYAVTSEWHEDPLVPTAEPTIDATEVASLSIDKAKRFVYVDVWTQVLNWLNDPSSNHGLVFTSAGAITLGSKEGSGTGYPAELEIDLDVAAQAITSGGQIIGGYLINGSVGSNQLASGSVGTNTLGTGVVTQGKLANASVGTAQLIDGNVTGAKLASGAVGTAALVDGSVTNPKLANSGVTINPGTGLTGGGTVALGGTLSLNATNGNTASTIVARDATGNFSAGTISGTFSGNGSALTSLTAGNITGQLVTSQIGNNAVTPQKTAPDCALFYDEKNATTDGGTSVAGWQARDLNGGDITLATSMSRAGNTITLQPGTYYIEAQAAALDADRAQLVLRDVTTSSAGDPTNATAVLRGISNYLSSSNVGATTVPLKGVLAVSGGARNYELWQYFQTAHSPNGLGAQTSNTAGVNNRYTEIYIIRLK